MHAIERGQSIWSERVSTPTYCLCHHQENFFLGIDCVFFARSISAELDWQWSRKQEGIVRFMIDSKDTAQRMMCLVPKTSTTCAGHENEAHLRLESQEATQPKRPKQRHPVLFLRWPHHAWASLRQCFRPPCKLYRNQRTRPTVFSISHAYTHLNIPPKYAHHVELAATIRTHRPRWAGGGGYARVRLEGICVPGSEQEERRNDGGPWYPRHRSCFFV